MTYEYTYEEDTMKKAVSEKFLNYCDEHYPLLNTNIGYRKFFMYLCFGTFYSKDSGNLIIPHSMIGRFCGIKIENNNREAYQYKLSNFRSGVFLKDFIRDILPHFEYTEYSKYTDLDAGEEISWDDDIKDKNKYGTCRQVSNKGLDNTLMQMVQEELEWNGKKYYFENGSLVTKVFDRVNKAKDRKISLEEYEKDKEYFNLNPTQQMIMDHLDKVSMSGRAFTQKIKENEEYIKAAIQSLELDHDDKETIDEKRLRQWKVIGSIKEDSRIMYYPTPLKRTPRLHPKGESILALSSSVRQAACKGWVEMDLKSSQFIVLAQIIDSPIAKALIAAKEHLWTYLHEDATGIKDKPNKANKKVYKEIIYGIAYGEGVTRLGNVIRKNNLPKLFKNPLISDLLKQRAIWFQKINKDGHIIDVWGKQHSLEKEGRRTDIFGNKVFAKERWEGSLGATMIQSIEMEIISVVFDVAKEYGESHKFQIMLFQHDGITVSFLDKTRINSVMVKMNEAIQKKCKELGDRLGLDLSAMELEHTEL